MKKYIKFALVFLAVGLICGVFYREFSKAYNVVNVYTTLGLAHTHFLVLGVAFTLIIGLITDKLNKHEEKLFKRAFVIYSAGVAGAGLMLVVRGVLDVLVKSDKIVYSVSSAADGVISGISGIFHALLGISLILIFISWLLKNKQLKQTDEISGT